MKALSPILLACALAIPSLAQDAKISATNKVTQSALTFPVSAAVISAPMVLTNGYISQAEQVDVAAAGKAVFSFTITTAGNYEIHGVVNAPDDESNSFYVNVDAQPDDLMIWDIEATSGFEKDGQLARERGVRQR